MVVLVLLLLLWLLLSDPVAKMRYRHFTNHVKHIIDVNAELAIQTTSWSLKCDLYVFISRPNVDSDIPEEQM